MPEANDTSIWDPTYPAYFQLGDVIGSIAQAHCGVQLDELTVQRWRELMGLMREVDTHYDDDPKLSPEATLIEVTTFDRFRSRYPNLTPEELGSATHNRLVARTRKIFKMGQLVAAADTPYRFLRLRAAEAVETAGIFEDGATDFVRHQTEFTKNFTPLLRSLGIAACLMDSAHDEADDYAAHKRSLRPTASFKAQALIGTTRRLVPGLRICRHPQVIRELWRAAHIRSDRSHYSTP